MKRRFETGMSTAVLMSIVGGSGLPTPAAPTLVAPAGASIGTDTTPDFSWEAVTGAATYDLQVDDNSDFSSPIIDETGIATNSYTPGSALAEWTTLYARVRGVNAGGTAGAWSTTLTFEIDTYDVRDQFTTTLAAGAVNGTNSEPGPGVRNVTDTGSAGVSITGAKIRVVGDGSWSHRGFWLTPAILREAGRVVRLDFNVVSGGATDSGMMGITKVTDANFTGYNNVGISFTANGIHLIRGVSGAASPTLNADGKTSGAFYFDLRAIGKYLLYDPQDGGDVELWWWDALDSTANLYIAAAHFANNLTLDYDNALSPQDHYFNIGALALASDSFNRADAALGSTDGAGHTEANGGSGKAWADTVGTWAIATNKAAASALSGGLAVATVDAGTKDVILEAALTRAGDNVGIISWTDANNYLIAYTEGTNCVCAQVVGGAAASTIITGAVTYAAGAPIRIRRKGTRILLYYNGLYVGTANTVNAALTGTRHGLYTTNTGNTFDNLICFGLTGYNGIRVGG